MFEGKRIAVLGAGKLGEALITGMIDANVVSRTYRIAKLSGNLIWCFSA